MLGSIEEGKLMQSELQASVPAYMPASFNGRAY